MGLIDISLPLTGNLPRWPGSPEFVLQWLKKLDDGDDHNNSLLRADMHFGTHVDAPFHFLHDGDPVDKLDLGDLVGPAYVAHILHADEISKTELKVLDLPRNTCRLLIRTRNSDSWASGETAFRHDYVGLTKDGARWIADQGIRLVGADYLSVGTLRQSREVHKVLLASKVVIVEGLNLAGVAPGQYELLCLPLNIVGAEGAPARAVLKPTKHG